MTQPHADRDHATWSASAASRNFKCPGALALTKDLPETTSEAADWGTCAHQIAERCLRDKGDADRFIGTIEKGKKHEFEVDEEMAETAQTYVDYVLERFVSAPGNTLWIEEKFSLAALNPPFDAGGTGDAVLYYPAEKRLEIVDLKGGRGVVVAAKGNPQLRTYALGAMLAHRDLDAGTIAVTIVQPRAGHPDGRIRSETFHVVELMEWANDMMVAMRRSRDAMDARDVMPESAWAATYLTPGDHCRDTFCKAQGSCPALRQKALDAVGVHFSPIDDKPRIGNAPDSGSPEERAARLDMLDMIEAWIKEVRAHEHRLAEMGQAAPGYGLVDKTTREKWVDEATVKSFLRAVGADEAVYLNPGKLRTPKQVREALAKAKVRADGLADLYSRPPGGTNLVRVDVTTRTVAPSVEKHFQAIKE